ncbi:MAG: hypothetical protein IK990_19745 [Ruminiclostridium sp.]|nr:hypothetical protein [Ruminiclostridium sp.]
MFTGKKIIGLILSLTMTIGILSIDSFAEEDDPADSLTAKETAAISESNMNGGLTAVGFEITEEEAEYIEQSLERDTLAAQSRRWFTPNAAAYANSAGDGSTDFFYRQLNSKEKALYDSLLSAANEFLASYIDVTDDYFAVVQFEPSSFTQAELDKVYNLFYHSNPKFFFTFGGYSYSLTAGKIGPMIMDKFKSASVRNSYKSQISNVTSSWMSEINAASGDFAKEEVIYTKLIEKIVYTHNSPFDQSLAAAIVDGACVCNGYAQSMVYFCNLANIDCIMTVSSEHAWNLVKLDGSWYTVDVTWMDQGAQGVWETWCNVPTYAKVKQQDSNSYHTYLSSLYSGISLPDGSSDHSTSFSSSTGSGGASSGTSTSLKGNSSITIKSTAVIPTLKITLPKSLSFVANPYKMSVDENGKAAASGSGSTDTFLVPVYGTGNSAWNITNNSGIGIGCLMYARVTNNNVSAVEIEDANNDNKNAVTGDAAGDDKRIIRLSLKGKAGNSGTNTAIKFSPSAPSSWSESNGCTKFTPIPDQQSLSITLDTASSSCLVGENCNDRQWTAKDTATITLVFNFDFVAAA